MTGGDPETFRINIKIKQIHKLRMFLSFSFLFFSSVFDLLHHSYIFYFLKSKGGASIPTLPPSQSINARRLQCAMEQINKMYNTYVYKKERTVCLKGDKHNHLCTHFCTNVSLYILVSLS